jgi:hypothetical protein
MTVVPLGDRAQAVINAAAQELLKNPGSVNLSAISAAVSRALADEVVPFAPPPHRGMRPGGSTLTYRETLSVEQQRIRNEILLIADELDIDS